MTVKSQIYLSDNVLCRFHFFMNLENFEECLTSIESSGPKKEPDLHRYSMKKSTSVETFSVSSFVLQKKGQGKYQKKGAVDIHSVE